MPKGSAPGERRGGRQKGTPNRITADIKALAQEYGADAIKTIVGIMRTSENDTARLSAAKELIDRGYGKASQAVEVNGEVGLVVQVVKFAGDSE
jgi:ketopantoate hydroxymethyltransferase